MWGNISFLEYYNVPSARKIEFQEAVLGYCKGIKWRNPYAVTLTLKVYNWPARLDAIAASENLHHFLNRFNRRMLGQHESGRRRLRTFSVLEAGQRPHFHLCIECPSTVAWREFETEVSASWCATRWARREIDVRPCHNINGWLGYMTKTKTKACYPEAIDWRNCY